MIDAAGAIYVIGGWGFITYYNDVWVSTDGGADRTRAGTHEAQGAVKWYSERAGTPHKVYSMSTHRGYL